MNWISEIVDQWNETVASSRLLKFGVLIGSTIALIGVLRSLAFVIMLGVAMILIGIFIPIRLDILYRFWMSLALVLGYFTSKLALTVLFILIIVPIGALRSILGKKTVTTGFNNKRTYWIKHGKI